MVDEFDKAVSSQSGQEPQIPAGAVATGIQFQLTFSDIIDTIRMYLKGSYFDDIKKAYVPYTEKPIMNEYGISLAMQPLVAYLHRGIVLSDLTNDEIIEIAKTIHGAELDIFFLNYEKVDLNIELIPSVARDIGVNVFASLRRAKNGQLADNIMKQTIVREQIFGDKKHGVFSRGD